MNCLGHIKNKAACACLSFMTFHFIYWVLVRSVHVHTLCQQEIQSRLKYYHFTGPFTLSTSSQMQRRPDGPTQSPGSGPEKQLSCSVCQLSCFHFHADRQCNLLLHPPFHLTSQSSGCSASLQLLFPHQLFACSFLSSLVPAI